MPWLWAGQTEKDRKGKTREGKEKGKKRERKRENLTREGVARCAFTLVLILNDAANR